MMSLYEVKEFDLRDFVKHIDMKDNKDNSLKFSGAIDDSTYIRKVIYNNPATIIIWSDGSKTTSKCDERDIYNPSIGFLTAFLKKLYPSKKVIKLLEDWVPEKINQTKTISLTDVRRKYRHER